MVYSTCLVCWVTIASLQATFNTVYSPKTIPAAAPFRMPDRRAVAGFASSADMATPNAERAEVMAAILKTRIRASLNLYIPLATSVPME